MPSLTTLPVPNIVRWIIEHFDLKFRELQPADKTKIDLSDNMQDNLL